MADYTPIGDGELVADQPITQALMTRLRDNPIAIIERAPGAPTYGQTVVNAGSNANGYYRIWDDGFIECWDQVAVLAGTTSPTVTLPVSFATTDYAVVCMQQANAYPSGGVTNDIVERDADRTLSSFRVSCPDGRNFQYYVMGY